MQSGLENVIASFLGVKQNIKRLHDEEIQYLNNALKFAPQIGPANSCINVNLTKIGLYVSVTSNLKQNRGTFLASNQDFVWF